MSKLPERLKELREEKGLSRRALVEILCNDMLVATTPSSYGRYEKGKRTPDVELLTKLCLYYNVSFDYILGITNVRTPDPDVLAASETTGLSPEAVSTLQQYAESSEFGLLDVIEVLIDDYTLLEYMYNYLLSTEDFHTYTDPQNPVNGLYLGVYQFSEYKLRDVFLFNINEQLAKLKEKIANDSTHKRAKYKPGP